MPVENIEWLNQNELRAYPFSEDSQRRPVDSAGNPFPAEYAIPNFLITDLIVSVPSTLETKLYVSRLLFSAGVLTLVISTGTEVVSSVSVVKENHVKNTPYRIFGVGSFSDVSGFIVIGDLDRFSKSFPEGVFSFSEGETSFETRCVRPSLIGVRSLKTVNDTTGFESIPMFGDINLVAGANIRFDLDVANNAIIVNADSSVGYNDDCGCDEKPVVRTINGIPIENVNITGDDCITVTTSSDGTISIKDTCSKPCCGCQELTYINNRIHDLNTSINKLTSYNNNLESKFDQFKTNYLMTNVNRLNRIQPSM